MSLGSVNISLPPKLPHAEVMERLEGLPGVAYVTRVDGTIFAYGRSQWHDHARRNGAIHLASDAAVLGANVFAAIADAENRTAYQGFTRLLASGRRDTCSFPYRCDSPYEERRMRMTMQRVELADGDGILYFSQSESDPLPHSVPLIANQLRFGKAGASPAIKLCSYCHYFHAPEVLGVAHWVTARDYYRLGGPDDACVSHGVCPECQQTIIEPQLRLLGA